MGEEITQITTHAADAKKRLLFQYQGKANLEAMLDAYFGDQIQDIEDALWTLFGRLDIDTAEGIQLDLIGSIIGESRLGKSDANYRPYIRARIGINTSEGDIEKVLSVWSLLTYGADVQLIELFPAALCLYLTEALSSDTLAQTTLDLLQKVVGAGISVDYIEVYDPDEAFGFADSGPDTKGFGNLLSMGTNTGVSVPHLWDTGATFISDGVEVGDMVYNNTDKTESEVLDVTSETALLLGSHIFTATGKGYTVNEDIGGKLAWLQAS